MNQSFFKGKVIIITGSSRGIGKSLAVLLGSYGARIVLNGRNAESLKKAEAELLQKGIEVISINGDISTEEDRLRLIGETVSRFGKLDVLVNNVGLSMRGEFADLSPLVIETAFNTNSVYPLLLTRIAIPEIRKSKGSIVFISSLAGLWGLPDLSVYAAAKMSLTAIAQSMRVELQPYGVHVGLIYVGVTKNEPDKTVMDASGRPVLIATEKRPFETSTERVSSGIASNIVKRKKQTFIGINGKIYLILCRYLPGLMEFLSLRRYKGIKKAHK